MSAHVLLTLLNELGKSDKMGGLLCVTRKCYNNTHETDPKYQPCG